MMTKIYGMPVYVWIGFIVLVIIAIIVPSLLIKRCKSAEERTEEDPGD